MSTHAEREAMRRVIERLAEFEPHCAEDLRAEFLPDAHWIATHDGVPECGAKLALPQVTPSDAEKLRRELAEAEGERILAAKGF